MTTRTRNDSVQAGSEPLPSTLCPAPEVPEENPFPYGWRCVRRPGSDGSEELIQVPLTLEDNLHPQEGDEIPERNLQEIESGDLARIFRSRLPRDTALVLCDSLVDWGVPAIRNHSPDVSVFLDLKVPHDPWRGTFHLKPSGGRCVLAIELVSPDTRDNDVLHKFREYYQVGIPLYVIVDEERQHAPRAVLGYRHTASGYEAIPLDAHGRLPLAPVGLFLGLRDDQVRCYDAATGVEIGDYT